MSGDSEAVLSAASPRADLLLFVYGSLKRGQANHVVLGAARFVSATRTAPTFALREVAGYPALVPGQRAILGELFDVSADVWDELDRFEGEDYSRQEIQLSDGAKALAYVARVPSAGVLIAWDEWPAPASGSH